ncbi:hypothetical protein Tco_1347531 [Tanacetum coccineum]
MSKLLQIRVGSAYLVAFVIMTSGTEVSAYCMLKSQLTMQSNGSLIAIVGLYSVQGLLFWYQERARVWQQRVWNETEIGLNGFRRVWQQEPGSLFCQYIACKSWLENEIGSNGLQRKRSFAFIYDESLESTDPPV